MTVGQQARDMLERIGVQNAQIFSAGDLVELANLINDSQISFYKLEAVKAQLDNAVNLLCRIYALLYPPPITTSDGKVHMFRPRNIDPHVVLQELSDRIRALPEEIASMQRNIENDS